MIETTSVVSEQNNNEKLKNLCDMFNKSIPVEYYLKLNYENN